VKIIANTVFLEKSAQNSSNLAVLVSK